jgi:hypothetical protein
MNICINYYGQLRDNSITTETHKKYIDDKNNNIYVLYTTWDTENVIPFKEYFTDSYIRQINIPNLNDEYNEMINKYKMDPSNPYKSFTHYLLGLYIKKESYNTINAFEEENNIKFDIIISMRTSVYINNNVSNYYNTILDNYNNEHGIVFVANEPCFDIYNQGASPDVFYITTNKSVMKNILSQIDILDDCLVTNTNYFHPETSFYKSLIYFQLKIVTLNLFAFPQKCS